MARSPGHLGETHRLPTVVVWGGDRERRWAQEIVDASAGYATLAPPTSLPELAALTQRGRIFVSSDTGPLHMAVAVGTPSVGLYGATRPADCGPYGAPHVAVQVRYQAGSRKQRRKASNACMREISAEMVCRHCDQVLAKTAQRGPQAA